MKKANLKELYDAFFDAGTPQKSEKINWRNFHLLTEELIEFIIFSSAIDFHKIASDDFENGLLMPPWIRLLGYKKATDEFPESIEYLEGYLLTLKLYYSLQTDLIVNIEKKVKEVKRK